VPAFALPQAGAGLLHGCPQTDLTWRKITPGLAERFTVPANFRDKRARYLSSAARA
jgi:hypothetical protein